MNSSQQLVQKLAVENAGNSKRQYNLLSIAIISALIAETLSEEAIAKRLGLNGSQKFNIDSNPNHQVVIESGPSHGSAHVSNGKIIYNHDGSGERDSLCYRIQDENGHIIKNGCGHQAAGAEEGGGMGILAALLAVAAGGAAAGGGGGGDSASGPIGRPAFTTAPDWRDLENLSDNTIAVTDDFNDALEGGDYVLLPSTGSEPTGYSSANPFIGDGGNDTIFGRDANEDIQGGAGNDLLLGGAGDDTLTGGPGNDTLNGEDGEDTYVMSGPRSDFIITGIGEDDDGNPMLQIEDVDNRFDLPPGDGQNEGKDLITIDMGNVTGQEQVIFDDAMLNVYIGGEGTDNITAGGGDNLIVGGPGDDSLTGAGGNDFIIGDDGNDTITGGGGEDVLDGREGNDILSYAGETIDIYASLDTDGMGTQEAREITAYTGNSEVTDTEDNDSLAMAQNVNATANWGVDFDSDIYMSTMIPHITIDSPAASNPVADFDYYRFTVDAFDPGVTSVNAIFDIDNADFSTQIFLYAADGTLLAQQRDNHGDQNDGDFNGDNSLLEYVFRAPGDYIVGIGTNATTDSGGSGMTGDMIPMGSTYQLHISLENHDFDSGNGFTMGALLDTIDNFEGIISGDGDDILKGNAQDNYIEGAGGIDKISSFSGNDTIFGGNGDDFLYAGADDDSLEGNNGNDLLVGGVGLDSISGGNGNDILVGDDLSGKVNSALPAFQQLLEYDNDVLSGDNGVDVIHGDVIDSSINLPGNLNFLTRNFGDDVIINEDGDMSIASQFFGDANSMEAHVAGDDGIFTMNMGNDTLSLFDSSLDIFTGDVRDASIDASGSNNTFNYVFGNDVVVDDGEISTDASVGDAKLYHLNISGDGNEINGFFGDEFITSSSSATTGTIALDVYNSQSVISGNNNQITTFFGDDIYAGAGAHVIGDVAMFNAEISGHDNTWDITTGTDSIQSTDPSATSIFGDFDSSSFEVSGERNTVNLTMRNDFSIDTNGAFTGDINMHEFRLMATAMDGAFTFDFGHDVYVDNGTTTSGGLFGDLNTGTYVFHASSSGNTVEFNFGADTINGSSGDDSIYGEAAAIEFDDSGTNTTSMTMRNDVLLGHDGHDVIVGDVRDADIMGIDSLTFGDDYIDGGDGNDLIFGDNDESMSTPSATMLEGGDDTLLGGDGDDTLNGGFGDDSLSGGDGADSLLGGAGNDTLDAGGDTGAGTEFVDGGADDDFVIGGIGNGSTLMGGTGVDTLDYSNDSRQLIIDLNAGTTEYSPVASGTHTESSPNTYNSPDVLDPDDFSTAFNANISSSTTIPHLSISGTGDGTFDFYSFEVTAMDIANYGTVTVILDIDGAYPAWDSQIFLYDPSDNKIGENDDSTVDSGSAATIGSTTRDSFLQMELSTSGVYTIGIGRFFTSGAASAGGGAPLSGTPITAGLSYTLHVSYDHDIDLFSTSLPLENISEFEVINGSHNADMIIGDSAANILNGNDGNDIISGDSGADTIEGGNGDDEINGGADDDSLLGGAGNDEINGDAGDDIILGGIGDDVIFGGSDNDLLLGEAGNDEINGGSGDDTILGDDGDDFLRGGSDTDELYGGIGNDELMGDSGNDSLFGGAGDDSLTGGNGDDALEGGDGADLFIYNNVNEANDSISDFDSGTDFIGLAGGVTITDTNEIGVGTVITLSSGTEITLLGVTGFSDADDIMTL